MKITPVDVAHKTFKKSIYGLEPKEVTSYLQAIADQLETLFKERNELRDKLREKELQLAEYKERDELLKNTLTTASQMSDKIREDAEKRADLIIQEASIKAQDLQRGAQETLRQTFTQINELKSLRIQFETNMRALAHAHMSLIDDGQKFMGMPEIHTNLPTTTNVAAEPEAFPSRLSSEISPLAADII